MLAAMCCWDCSHTALVSFSRSVALSLLYATSCFPCSLLRAYTLLAVPRAYKRSSRPRHRRYLLPFRCLLLAPWLFSAAPTWRLRWCAQTRSRRSLSAPPPPSLPLALTRCARPSRYACSFLCRRSPAFAATCCCERALIRRRCPLCRCFARCVLSVAVLLAALLRIGALAGAAVFWRH